MNNQEERNGFVRPDALSVEFDQSAIIEVKKIPVVNNQIQQYFG
jgi:hypothetical protein